MSLINKGTKLCVITDIFGTSYFLTGTIFYGESVLEIFASFDQICSYTLDTYVMMVKLAKIFRTLST